MRRNSAHQRQMYADGGADELYIGAIRGDGIGPWSSIIGAMRQVLPDVDTIEEAREKMPFPVV